jgi:precorrin-6Y C5,15-methyltransferase (decarboxylating)
MITVVGVSSMALPPAATKAIEDASLVIGSERLLALVSESKPKMALGGSLEPVLEAIAATTDNVCVLASGDPGWFGIVRALAARFGPAALTVHPAPSAVSEAFARLGIPWDDAAVVSAHGRPLADAARLAVRSPKVAVLTSPDASPAALGLALLDLGAAHDHVAVCSQLGWPMEDVTATDLAGLAGGAWDPLSVVVLWNGTGVTPTKSLAWGLPEDRFAHRDAMITKAEVRAVVLGLLAMPANSGVMWDIGAGSGSVAIECARVAPWMETIAIDEDTALCAQNVRAHDVGVRIVTGTAPGCLAGLPDPDRVFVGGGGISVLKTAIGRLRPDGVIVATHAAIDRAAEAATLLGNMTSIAASRGRQLPDGGWRLEANNPVFVTWGPTCES